MAGGATSVQTFFIISGFLIAMILDVKYNKPGQLWLFYSNRALRIYSTYWVILAGVLLLQLGAHMGVHESVFDLWRQNFARLGGAGTWYLALSNLFIVGQDAALFMALGQHGLHWSGSFWNSTPIVPSLMVIPPAWSLSLELMFYALAPWILRLRTRWIFGIFCLSLLVRVGLWNAGLRVDPWSYRFFPNELSMFLAGALAYRVIYRHPLTQNLSLKAKIFALGLIPAVVLYPFYDRNEGVFFSATKLLFLSYAIVAIPLLFRLTSKNSFDRRLGDLSYPLYLCHFSIVQILNHFSARFGLLLRTSVAIAVSCGVAWLCVVVLEHPLDKFRQARLNRSATAIGDETRMGRVEKLPQALRPLTSAVQAQTTPDSKPVIDNETA